MFLRTHRESALAEAKASDALRAHGIVPSPLAGIPVSVKDLFDVAGDITRAGSKVLADAAPATSRCHRGAAAAPGGRDHRRPHQHGRIRVLRTGPQSALRHAEESLGSGHRPHSRRLVFGGGGVGFRRHGGDGPGHRHRRLGAHSCRAVRPHRLQAHRQAHTPKTAPFRCRLRSIRSARSRAASPAARWSTAYSPAKRRRCRRRCRSRACAWAWCRTTCWTDWTAPWRQRSARRSRGCRGRRAAERRALRSAAPAAADQPEGRPGGGRGLCDTPRPDRAAQRRVRPARRLAHPARRRHQRGRLYRRADPARRA